MYVLLDDNGEVAAFPYSIFDLRRDNPDTSFGTEMPATALADFRVYPVVAVDRPEGSPIERVVEAAPLMIDDEWTQQWTVEPLPIDEAKATLWNAAKSHREQRENGGVTIPGVGTVQSDAISRGYINGAVLMAQIALTQSQPYAINWTLADNSVVTLDALGMIAVGVAAGQHVAACHAAAQAIRASIDAAEDHAALAVIDVEAGYP